MSEFKVGDKVVHTAPFAGAWEEACAYNNVPVTTVCTVIEVWDGSGNVTVAEVIPEDGCLGWSSCYFRHADAAELALTAPEPEQGAVGLKKELARCCGTVADKEAIAAEIAELEQSSEMLRADLAGETAKLQRLQEQFDGVCAQLEEAVNNAKQLGADLEYSRHSWRLAQYQLTQVKAVLGGAACTLHTVNLGELSSQLRGIAAGLDSIDNGADAVLVRRAGNLLDLFSMAIVDGRRL